MSSISMESAKDRDQRIKSAKKKLKTYRAKQAQMEQAKRQSLLVGSSSVGGHSAADSSSSSLSYSSTPARAMGSLVTEAARESNATMDTGRHSRSFSRSAGAGHGRGHSRTGSISVAPISTHASAPSTSSIIPFSTSAHRLSSTFIANTAHSHTRGHSRSGSRSLAAAAPRSRPASFIGVAQKEASNSAGTWKDVDDAENTAPAQEERQAHPHDILKTPTLNNFESTSNEATPIASMLNSSRPTLVQAVLASAAAASSAAENMTADDANATAKRHSRRPSRHTRKDSVSTRKESMEIMGGLGTLGISAAFEAAAAASAPAPFSSNRNSRRISSHRWSGLQPASVLFGGSADAAGKRASQDWRSALAAAGASNADHEDRMTALEKLEGRAMQQQQLHSRQSSVQLPSFDDVHGEKGMDKRASLDLLEANAKTTSSDRSLLASVPFAAPASTNAAGGEFSSNSDGNGGDALGTLMEEEEEEEDSTSSSPVRERSGFDFATEEERRRRKEVEQEVIKRTRRSSLTPAPLKLKSRPASLFLSQRPSNGGTSSNGLTPVTAVEETEEATVPAAIVEEEIVADTTQHERLSSVNSVNSASSSAVPQLAATQRKLAEARLAGALPDPSARMTTAPVMPTLERKRSWRASMPSAPGGLATLTLASNPSPLASQAVNTPARQGMRALRLASGGHRAQAESTSSHASSASLASSTATPSSASGSNKRGSLMYNTSASSTPHEVTTPANNRRRSIQYRASPMESPSAELSTASAPWSPSPTSSTGPSKMFGQQQQQSSPLSVGGSGVPMAMFEELKSKHQRDVALLDDARRNVARLEAELASETERARREYGELEHWSAEEKRSLGSRIEHLEASVVEVTQVREAREEHHKIEVQKLRDEQAELRTRLEDAEAEREMLREDVEGWRARCKDLEKAAARGSGPSPMLSATARDGSVSPIADFDAPPPPQAIALLRDMRQQILTLARSLEEERSRVASVQSESDELRLECARLTTSLHDQQSMNDTANTTMMTDMTSPDKSRLSMMPASMSSQSDLAGMTGSFSASSLASNGSSGFSTKKKRNHVFAYDSSMESGGTGSTSIASGSFHPMTEGHAHDDGGDKAVQKDDETFIAEVQADLVGLGMGALAPLAEEEEASVTESRTCSTPPPMQQEATFTRAQNVRDHDRDSFDIEAGGRPSVDVDSVAPSTPALDHHYPSPGQKTSSLSSANEAPRLSKSSGSGSATSSMDSRMEPTTPHHLSSNASQDTLTTPAVAADDDDDDDEDELDELPAPSVARPEFIREWSFESAMSAVQAVKKQSRPKLRIGVSEPMVSRVSTASQQCRQRRRRNKNGSIDDFFGIMGVDEDAKLPALPTPEEALEMPPLQLLDTHTPSPYSAPLHASAAGAGGAYPRMPSGIRAPIAKSSRLYGHNLSDRSTTSSNASLRSLPSKASQPMSQAHSQHDLSVSSSNNGGGAGMFSRVVSLTSAFGGYLLGGGAAAGSQSADGAYASPGRYADHRGGNGTGYGYSEPENNASFSWAVTRRHDIEEA